MRVLLKHIYILPFCILFTLTACTKYLEIPPSSDQLTTSQVFADSTDAVAALTGIYTRYYQSNALTIFNGSITVNTGLAVDELIPNPSNVNYLKENEIYTNSISSTGNGAITDTWTQSFQLLYQINACIEGFNASKGISTSLQNQLLGEVKLFRGFYYFNLINVFGAVPLVTTTDFKKSQSLPRTPIDSIYSQIISDLIEAQNLLSDKYPIAGSKGRPNKYAALSLLARVYLYKQNWAAAENAASQVIQSGLYNLEPNLNNVFLTGSKEAIWQIPPIQPGYGTAEGYFFVPLSGVVPAYRITSSLLNSFETNDQRKNTWLNSTTVGTNVYYYPYKYKLSKDNTASPKESYVIFRLAEPYLIRAEARAKQGSDLSGAAADLNAVRNRSNLANTIATTQSELLSAIAHEKQDEFFCEWGSRWFEIKRNGQADTIMGGLSGVCAAKGGIWNANWMLWPIPYSELQLNPFLIQNSGY